MIHEAEIRKVLSDDEIIILAHAMDVGAVKVLAKIITAIRDNDRVLNEMHPRRDDADLRNDWVFKTGSISRLNDVLSLPQVAKGMIDKPRKQ